MAKTLRDIKMDPKGKKLNLRRENFEKEKPIKKNTNTIFKNESPIKEVKDIKGEKNEKYIYIKGKKFKAPKALGNIIRMGVGGFLIILLFNIINVYVMGKSIERNISETAYEGYYYLLDAGKSATKIQFDNAIEAFNNAIVNFNDAQEDLWFLKTDKTFYAEDSSINKAAVGMLEGGKHFAEAGKYFLEAIEEFNKMPLYFVTKNNPKNINPPSITESLKTGLEKTNLAIDQISLASEKIQNINEKILPPELRARVSLAKEKILQISDTLKSTSEYFPAILKLFGDRYPHRYLVLFQNNNEIRPTGGFIGSYAIVDINDGYIENLKIHDVYDLDGSFYGIIEPPEEFYEFTSNWRFRDSNYSPDFEVSAKKARWFLETEGGPTVDSVIAINQGLLKDMLEITGPVQVGNFGELNSENYNLLLSYVIEGKVWGPEDPKHILKVFVPEFQKEIMKEENISKVTSKIYKAIQQKHIMMYSSDEDIQDLFEALGLSGKMYVPEEDEDYLSVINIATGGTKSEQFIEESILHHTYIEENGLITDEVTVKRTHLWTDEIYFKWRDIIFEYGFTEMPDGLIDILGRGANKTITKIYVPAGATLIDYEGGEVETHYDKDLKKTYFSVKMKADVDKAAEVWVKYRLPFRLEFDPVSTYKLIAEKQPGSKGSIFTKTLSTDDEIYNLAVYPKEARITKNEDITYATNLVYDKYFSSIWGK